MSDCCNYRQVTTVEETIRSCAFVCVALVVMFGSVKIVQARSPQMLPIDQLDAPVGGSTTDKFGQSISMNSEFGAVGTPGLNVTVGASTHLAQGGVHIYKNMGDGIFNFQTTLTATIGTANDGCGMSVSASADWVVGGAPGRNIFTTSNQLQAGIVWAWKRNGSNWQSTPYALTHPDPQSLDLFGSAVALDEQSKDGVTHRTIVAGAPSDNVVYVDCGSVCVFEWNDVLQQWDRTAFIAPPTLAGEDPYLNSYGYFGSSVAIYDDFMIIGAKRQTVSVSKQGTAYVFRRNTLANPAPTILQTNPAWGEWCLVQRLTSSAPVPDEAFGAAMSVSPWNLMVGAPGGSTSKGSVSIYDLDPTTERFVFNAVISAVGGQVGDQFGASVVMKSNAALIGAPGVDAGTAPNTLTNRGLVYVFTRGASSCESWSQGLTYYPPPTANVAEAGFGTALDLSSNDVVISAPKAPNQQLGQGNVFTYSLDTVSCPPDVNGDGGVDGADLVTFFSHWGGCSPSDQVADYNHSGCVDADDLAYILAHWGPCICGSN